MLCELADRSGQFAQGGGDSRILIVGFYQIKKRFLGSEPLFGGAEVWGAVESEAALDFLPNKDLNEGIALHPG